MILFGTTRKFLIFSSEGMSKDVKCPLVCDILWQKRKRMMNSREKQIISRKRVADHGEVFTADREVEAMCDLVKNETERIDSRFLEPACGDGNFLSVILKRKLDIVEKKYKRSSYDWERNSLLALGSLYGVEILQDNVDACRDRLFDMWDKSYIRICKKDCSEETRKAARFILCINIVCGNALTFSRVDHNGNDTGIPIIFSEWTFPFNDAKMHRKDYIFSKLLESSEDKISEKEDISADLFGIEENNSGEGVFLKQYIAHYKRIYEDDTREQEVNFALKNNKEADCNGK